VSQIQDIVDGLFPDNDDHELDVSSPGASDSAPFALLYRLHSATIFRYVRTYTENDEDAADLAQLVFLRVLEALPTYQDRGLPFRAWVFRIARNAAIDTYRSRRRTLPWDHFPATLQPFLADVEERAIQREAINRLRVLIGQFSPEKQELLALRFAGALTVREIALVVGRSEDAVKKQLTRTMRTLREEFGDDWLQSHHTRPLRRSARRRERSG